MIARLVFKGMIDIEYDNEDDLDNKVAELTPEDFYDVLAINTLRIEEPEEEDDREERRREFERSQL